MGDGLEKEIWAVGNQKGEDFDKEKYPTFETEFKDRKGQNCNSSVNIAVLGHQLPPPLLPPLCNMRGACLGKY